MHDSLVAVVPVLVGPLQVLLVLLPAILIALATLVVSALRPRAMAATCRVLWRLKIEVAVLAIVVVAAVWAMRSWWSSAASPGGEISAAARDGEDWPLFRGGVERLGVSGSAPGPTAGGVHWAFAPAGVAFFSSPAVAGNRVYATSAEVSAFAQSGAIWCLDATSGAVVWRSAPPDYRPTFSSPAVAGDYLVCGEGLHETDDARVVCVDIREGVSAGRIVWTHRTRSHVECTPVVEGDRVWVGAGDDGIWCLGLAPAEDGSARVLWHVAGERYLDAETALLARGDRLWAGLGVGGKAICLLDANSGEELRRVATPYPVFAPPALADGRLFVGMGNGDYVYRAEEIRDARIAELEDAGASREEIDATASALAPGGAVWCLDAATLELEWTFELARTVLGAIAVSDGHVFFGCRDGLVRSLDIEGRLVASWDARAPIVASPAVDAEHVWVVTTSGRLHALERRRLAPVWELALTSGSLAISSPAVRGGRAFVGTERSGLLAVGEPASARTVPLWAGLLGGPGVGASIDDSAVPEVASVEWSYPPIDSAHDHAVRVTSPLAATRGRVFCGLEAGGRRSLECVERDETGRARRRWSHPTRNAISRSPVVIDERVVVVEGAVGDGGRRLVALDAGSGAIEWSLDVARAASGFLAATPSEIVVERASGELARVDFGGRETWTTRLGPLAAAPAVVDSLVVVATAQPAALIVLDLPTGRVLWDRALEEAPRSVPIADERTIWFATSRGVAAFRLLDGRPREGWSSLGVGVSGELVFDDDAIVCVDDGGELLRLARDDGRALRRIAGARVGSSVLVGRDALLFAAAGGIRRLRRGDGEADPELWASDDEIGARETALILADSRVWVGVAARGLLCLRESP